METKCKPFMNYGPSKIDGELHSTKSSLLLFVNDDDELRSFRASKDSYKYSTNFCDLPEFIDDTDRERVNEP